MGAGARSALDRVRPDRRRELDPRTGLSAARRLHEDPLLLRRKMEAPRGPVLPARCSLSALGQGRPSLRRSLRAQVDPLGQARRLPTDRHDRRPAQARWAYRPGGTGADEAELRPDHRGGRGLRDHGQHRGPRLLHDPARDAGADAGVCRFAVSGGSTSIPATASSPARTPSRSAGGSRTVSITCTSRTSASPWPRRRAAPRPGSRSATAPSAKGSTPPNIRQILTILRDRGYAGVLSMECEGQGGPMIDRSLSWLQIALAGTADSRGGLR